MSKWLKCGAVLLCFFLMLIASVFGQTTVGEGFEEPTEDTTEEIPADCVAQNGMEACHLDPNSPEDRQKVLKADPNAAERLANDNIPQSTAPQDEVRIALRSAAGPGPAAEDPSYPAYPPP